MKSLGEMFRSRRSPSLPGQDEAGPATPRGHRNSYKDWAFPFPAPGRPRAKTLAPHAAHRFPFVDMQALDSETIPQRSVRAPLSAGDFKKRVLEFADDAGIISIDDPAIAHERDEILWIYPHTRSLVCLIAGENRAAMQSRYLPTANHELYTCEERVFEMSRRTVRAINDLGGEGLSTTIGWPQEVSQRWADKIWPLSHKLVAQAAGLGVIGLSRNLLHREFGAYCLIDTVLTNLEFLAEEWDKPISWNPCTECNLCVASCPTEAIKSDGQFDFFACYNHTYRDSIPGFLDMMRDLGEAKPGRFAKRWSDAELAALWQSMAFKVEYRCFNCVSTCPAEMTDLFHGDKRVRRDYLDHVLKPLSRQRAEVDEQFVIDTVSAREKHGIPPGEWRTPPDRTKPSARGVRLVPLSRIRTGNIDSMMRNMPHYFRSSEAKGLDFTAQIDLTGEGGGRWVIRVADERCDVFPGVSEKPDLSIRAPGTFYLAVHRREASPVWGLLLGRIRLSGNRRLFLVFPRIFGFPPGDTIFHRVAWRARRAWKRRVSAGKEKKG